MTKKMLDFQYRPLVNTLYERYPDYFSETDYQDIIETNFNNKTTQHKENYYKIKTTVLMALDTIFWFLFSLLMRCLVFLGLGFLGGILFFTVNPNLFYQIAHSGMKYYDICLSWLFRISSQEINSFILSSSESTKISDYNFADKSYSLETEYLFFGIMIMLVAVLIWFAFFVWRLYREQKKYDHELENIDRNMNTKKAYRLLNCDQFDSLRYIKKQFYHYYFKKMIHKQEQINCIAAYVCLCQEKEFYDSFSEDQQIKAKRKFYYKLTLYIINLICCATIIAFTFSLLFLASTNQTLSFTTTVDFQPSITNLYTYIIDTFPAGFTSLLSSYQTSNISYQAACHIFFSIFALIFIFKFYPNVIKPIVRFKERYLNFLVLKEKQSVEAPIIEETVTENTHQAKTFETPHQVKKQLQYKETQNTFWFAILVVYLIIYFTAINLS